MQNEQITQLLDHARRNEAIAIMLGFKKYIPSDTIKHNATIQYCGVPISWYHIPNIGRFVTLEMRFNSDWNWLVSALIEMKKFEITYKSSIMTSATHKLYRLFIEITSIKVIDFDLQKLYLLVSDYALELQEQLAIQHKNSQE